MPTPKRRLSPILPLINQFSRPMTALKKRTPIKQLQFLAKSTKTFGLMQMLQMKDKNLFIDKKVSMIDHKKPGKCTEPRKSMFNLTKTNIQPVILTEERQTVVKDVIKRDFEPVKRKPINLPPIVSLNPIESISTRGCKKSFYSLPRFSPSKSSFDIFENQKSKTQMKTCKLDDKELIAKTSNVYDIGCTFSSLKLDKQSNASFVSNEINIIEKRHPFCNLDRKHIEYDNNENTKCHLKDFNNFRNTNHNINLPKIVPNSPLFVSKSSEVGFMRSSKRIIDRLNFNFNRSNQ